jgi:signal transduction histidine kinase
VELTVRDDGVGFDPPAARRRAAEGASFGLLGMQERVDLLGGQFAVESRPGAGTLVRARFTLPDASPANGPARQLPADEVEGRLPGR